MVRKSAKEREVMDTHYNQSEIDAKVTTMLAGRSDDPTLLHNPRPSFTVHSLPGVSKVMIGDEAWFLRTDVDTYILKTAAELESIAGECRQLHQLFGNSKYYTQVEANLVLARNTPKGAIPLGVISLTGLQSGIVNGQRYWLASGVDEVVGRLQKHIGHTGSTFLMYPTPL